MASANPDRAWQVARWQLRIGWLVAAGTLVARLTTVVLQLMRGHINAVDFGLAVLKSGVLIAVVWYYPRHGWPAYLMCFVWPFGFILAWIYVHPSPAVMAVGLLIGLGFTLGARGAWRLHELRASEHDAVTAG